MADSTSPVRLCARRPAYGLLFSRHSIIGGGVGISSEHATEIGAVRAVGEVTGLPSLGEELPARSLFLVVAELSSFTDPPRGLIPRGPELAMVAFTVAERGEMMFGFILARSAFVWARVRVAGGLEDTTSFFSPFSPTTRLPDPVEDLSLIHI